jgi:hypothetical protein
VKKAKLTVNSKKTGRQLQDDAGISMMNVGSQNNSTTILLNLLTSVSGVKKHNLYLES